MIEWREEDEDSKSTNHQKKSKLTARGEENQKEIPRKEGLPTSHMNDDDLRPRQALRWIIHFTYSCEMMLQGFPAKRHNSGCINSLYARPLERLMG